MGTIYIVCASLMWGIVHSLLASNQFKRFVRRIFGAAAFYRLYRFSYNVFSVASIFPIFVMLAVFPDRLVYTIPAPWVYVTTLGQGAAFFIIMAGVMQTGILEFAGLAQLSAVYDDSLPARLVTEGLYAFVRHPLYSGGLVFIWLSSDMTVNRLALWIIFSLYILVGAYFEERKLLSDFGPVYAEYRQKTPMLIPGILKRP